MATPPNRVARAKPSGTRSAKIGKAPIGDAVRGLGIPPLLRAVGRTAAIDANTVADAFGISMSQLAETIGIGREAFYKPTRSKAPKTQARLREMLEILSRVSAWAGGKEQALAWYRAQPLSAFGGRTAESLVKSGQATMLRDYLDHIALGGYA